MGVIIIKIKRVGKESTMSKRDNSWIQKIGLVNSTRKTAWPPVAFLASSPFYYYY